LPLLGFPVIEANLSLVTASAAIRFKSEQYGATPALASCANVVTDEQAKAKTDTIKVLISGSTLTWIEASHLSPPA
jgi:hypothetical protein